MNTIKLLIPAICMVAPTALHAQGIDTVREDVREVLSPLLSPDEKIGFELVSSEGRLYNDTTVNFRVNGSLGSITVDKHSRLVCAFFIAAADKVQEVTNSLQPQLKEGIRIRGVYRYTASKAYNRSHGIPEESYYRVKLSDGIKSAGFAYLDEDMRLLKIID